MRQCPTLSGDERPLIAHSITSCLCLQRQREFYHKCHRCEYRGQAADFSLPVAPSGTAASNGVVRGAGASSSASASAQREDKAEDKATGKTTERADGRALDTSGVIKQPASANRAESS